MSNFIQDIEIKNFKSIRHQKIEGCKRINVFIGYPNVGKSNILEAMSMLSYINAGNAEISKLTRVQEFNELFFDGNIKEPIVIRHSEKSIIELAFESDYNLLLKHIVLLEQTKASIVKHLRINLETSPSNIYANNSDEEAVFRSRNVVLNNLRFKKIDAKKYQYKSSINKDESGYSSLFFPDGQNLFYTIERNSELRKDVVDLLSFYGLKLLFDKGNKYSMKAMKTLGDETVFSIPFHQIADTLQRLIFYKAAIQTNENTVLIFEEPEAHMFPPYIRKFTADVVADETNQFFIATHSPYVLDEFIEEAGDDLTIFLVDYKEGETIVKNLTRENVDEIRDFGVDLFFNLENYLKNG